MTKYCKSKPCNNCPFRIGEGAVRLTEERAYEIAETDGEFPCHKTTTAGGGTGKNLVMCAGFLIYREKIDHPNQMMRIAGRLGLYDPDKLDKASFDEVIDDPEDMIDWR